MNNSSNINNINKYTIKIKNFLDNNLSDCYNRRSFESNKFVKYFQKNVRRVCNENYDKKLLSIEKITQAKIKKLHSYEDNSLLYIIMSRDDRYNTNFSTETDFFNWVRENHNKIDLNNMKHKEFHEILFNPYENRKELHNMMYESIFVSLDVIHHAESEDLNYIIYKNTNTEIHIYHPNSNSGPNVDMIMKIISFYREITKNKMNIKLVIFYGEQKKYLPMCKENKIISTDNVNSGSTIKQEIIQIWRKEEFYKVLIHELVHYFSIDFYIRDNIYTEVNNHFKKFIKIKGIDRVNESYTEILAMLIHSLFYSEIHNVKFNDVISYELTFSYFQVAKILNYFNMTNYNDLLSNEYSQTTSAFSYYIVKCMFLEKFCDMLDFWEKYGISILGNQTIEEEFVKLYKKIVTLESLDGNKINKIINIIKQHENNSANKSANKFVLNTMRMSMHQL